MSDYIGQINLKGQEASILSWGTWAKNVIRQEIMQGLDKVTLPHPICSKDVTNSNPSNQIPEFYNVVKSSIVL